jgi:hypothetical protein
VPEASLFRVLLRCVNCFRRENIPDDGRPKCRSHVIFYPVRHRTLLILGEPPLHLSTRVCLKQSAETVMDGVMVQDFRMEKVCSCRLDLEQFRIVSIYEPSRELFFHMFTGTSKSTAREAYNKLQG